MFLAHRVGLVIYSIIVVLLLLLAFSPISIIPKKKRLKMQFQVLKRCFRTLYSTKNDTGLVTT